MASYLAYQLLRDALSEFGDLSDGQATGGSTTTIIDTNRETGEDQTAFDEATAIVTYDAGGAGVAPEGQWSRITGYTPSTNTFALASTLTAAVASGDHYVVTSNLFKHTELIRLMNEALRHRKLGTNVPVTDTSITTANNQTEYTLPAAIKEKDIRRIWLQTNLNDANDNQYTPIQKWRVTYSAAGSAALLVLPQCASGHAVHIEYLGTHPAITAYNSPISEYIPPDLAVALFVERLASGLSAKAQHSAAPFRMGWDKAADQLEEAFRRNWPLNKPRRQPQLTVLGAYKKPDQFTYPE